MNKIDTADFVLLITDLNYYVSAGLDNLKEAGDIVVLLRQSYSFKEIAEGSNFLSVGDLKRLEAVGASKLSPALFAFKSPATNIIAKLPIEAQEEFVANGVSVIEEKGGKFYSKVVPIGKINRSQAKLAFDGTKIRNITAQKAYLKNLPEVTKRVNYSVQNGSLLVYKPMKFSKKQLTEILAQM